MLVKESSYLLENEAKPNVNGRYEQETILHISASKGNLDIGQLLVWKCAKIDALELLNKTSL